MLEDAYQESSSDTDYQKEISEKDIFDSDFDNDSDREVKKNQKNYSKEEGKIIKTKKLIKLYQNGSFIKFKTEKNT